MSKNGTNHREPADLVPEDTSGFSEAAKERPPEKPEIQKADPILRRKVLVVLGFSCLLCVGGVLALDTYLSHLQGMARTSLEEAAQKTHAVATLVLAAISIGTLSMAAYLGLLAIRTLRHRRFPPPDTRVISDTKILQGLRARIYGWTSLVLALLLVLVGILLPIQAQRVLERQLDASLRPITQDSYDLGLAPW